MQAIITADFSIILLLIWTQYFFLASHFDIGVSIVVSTVLCLVPDQISLYFYIVTASGTFRSNHTTPYKPKKPHLSGQVPKTIRKGAMRVNKDYFEMRSISITSLFPHFFQWLFCLSVVISIRPMTTSCGVVRIFLCSVVYLYFLAQ